MLTLDSIVQFSCTHCLAICAVLIPINLLATLRTMVIVWQRPNRWVYQARIAATVASLFAILLLSHVLAWLSIGVVMAPTYILGLLGCLCIATNTYCGIIASRPLDRNPWLSLSQTFE